MVRRVERVEESKIGGSVDRANSWTLRLFDFWTLVVRERQPHVGRGMQTAMGLGIRRRCFLRPPDLWVRLDGVRNTIDGMIRRIGWGGRTLAEGRPTFFRRRPDLARDVPTRWT